MDARTPFTSWSDLKQQLLARFSSSQAGSLCERFLGIKQTGSVADFRREFEMMFASMTGLSDEVLESTFVKGLKAEIRAEIRVLKPIRLGPIMDMAQRLEEKNQALKSLKEYPGLRVNRPNSSGFSEAAKIGGSIAKSSNWVSREIHKNTEAFPTKMVAWGNQPNYTQPTRDGPPRRRLNLTEAKLQARREKGLCFHCNEKYSLDHRCKRELQILIVHDEDREEGVTEEDLGELVNSDMQMATENLETVELSLNSVLGLTLPSTMKIKGKLGPKEVTILIDCGATHNFLSLELIEELKPPLLKTTNYGVVMGTGMAVRGKRICKGVIVEMQGLTVVEDFLPLTLGSTDVILRMQWLGTLGTMKAN